MPSSSTSRPLLIGERLLAASRRRRPLADRSDLTAYRLLHGAADGFDGLAADRFGDLLVVHADRPDVVPDLSSLATTGYLKVRPRQAHRVPADQRSLFAPDLPTWGPPVAQTVVLENGMRFLVKPGAGLSVGLFLDMREVRAWMGAESAGRTVLNLFAYTCGFGVAAALGGASRVLNLDLSRSALEWGRENYALNGLPVDPHDFVYGDAFDWLARFARRGERFDIVIVDPPSFSTAERGAFAVERDYPRLVRAAALVVARRGMLLTATNHAGISASRFASLVARGLREAGRDAQPIAGWHEPDLDFPVAPGSFPYLQVQALALD